jgi:GT2 family glycosyltransferase
MANMSKAKVAVVILNYNGEKHLSKFLPSVVQHTPEAEIIIADNASTDSSLLLLAESYPLLRVIPMKENTGFSKGYNLALQQVQAEYYVLLNSDVEVTPCWLNSLLDLMDSNPHIAACQPKIKSYLHRKSFEYAGAGGGYIDSLGYPFCRGRIFDTLEIDEGQYNDTQEVFWASGACMVIRSAIYHQLGGLDDDFFAHMEEIDLCWQIKNAGYQVFYCGESEVYHLGGGTLGYQNPRKFYLNFRNSLVMLIKNLPTFSVFPIVFLRMILDGVAGAQFLAKGDFAKFLTVIQAHFYIYRYLFYILKKRKVARKNAKTNTKANTPIGILKGSIVWRYFARRQKKFSQLEM